MGGFPGGQGGDGKSGQEMLLGFCIGLIVGGSVGAVIMAAVQIAVKADEQQGVILLRFGDDDEGGRPGRKADGLPVAGDRGGNVYDLGERRDPLRG